MKVKFKKNIIPFTYIFILILGAIMYLSISLTRNIWFDESYSVAIIKHSFAEICRITANDVHPPLYYFMLKIFTLIFGNDIIVMKVFSVISSILFASLGFTHIRKILGDKAGIIFTILAIFTPAMLDNADEVRMYGWAIYFVTLCGIYAYKAYISNSNKDWILFGVFGILSAYTHYYALMGIAFVNLFLIIAVIRRKRVAKCFIVAISEIILYIPWIAVLLGQIINVSHGFWISINYKTIFSEILQFYFSGSSIHNLNLFISYSIAALFLYFLIRSIVNKSDRNIPVTLSLIIYIVCITIALIVSLVRPVFVVRYLLPITGFLYISMAYSFSKIKSKKIIYCISLVFVAITIMCYPIKYGNGHNADNIEFFNRLQSEYKEGDIIVNSSLIISGVVSEKFPSAKQFCYYSWGGEQFDAYKPSLSIYGDLSFLDNYEGRIWCIDSWDETLYKILSTQDKRFISIEQKPIEYKSSYSPSNYMKVSIINKTKGTVIINNS